MASADFHRKEEEILKFWEENRIFKRSLEQRKGSKFFSFFDGPPFATGLPHYGHILASIIKDLVGRYWTMKGSFVPRRWGWDCHGLPIENIVEQELKISGKKQIEEIGVDVFNKTSGETVLRYANEWDKTVKRIGRWVDFENSYKTMDSTYVESVWWAFRQIWDKGLVYEGRKVLLYCPRCETPISNFEVAMDNSYKETEDEAVVAKFKLKFGGLFPENTYLLAWTTTPWTLPSNIALAVKEDVSYVLAEVGAAHYVVAKNRLDILDSSYKVEKELKGGDIIGAAYEPLFDVDIKSEKMHHVFPGEFVNTEEGTGIVHIATGYGEEDYNLGLKFGLPILSLLDEKGVFTGEAPKFLQGKYFLDSNSEIIKHLKEKDLAYKKEKFVHQYPFCWRCATPLYYTALPAWFINIQKIKDRLLELNKDINWYPEHLKHGRFENGILSAPDWNISRNRYWASPIPIWRCDGKGCGSKTCIGSLSELIESSINFDEVYSFRNIEELDLHKPYIDRIKLKCQKCGLKMTRVSEVIDCWVESASMPFAEIHYPFENKDEFERRFPADFVAEYIAQTRAWFYVMHVISTILFDRAPFKNVVTTGTILNEKGEKLSKSKKNYPDHEEIIEKYGVDALRFYMFSSVVMKAENLFFSENEVEEVYKKIILILVNVLSFYKLYPSEDYKDFLNADNVLDKWILSLLSRLISELTQALDKYDVSCACKLIEKFIDDLSVWYLRRSRERFKERDEGGIRAFKHVLLEFSKLIAPITPFLAEHIYKEAGGPKESVHLDDWPQANKEHINEAIAENMDLVRKVCAIALSIRDDKRIKVRQPLATLITNADLGEEFLDLIKDEVNVKEVKIQNQKPDEKFVTKEEDSIFAGLDIDIGAELIEEGIAREFIRKINQLRKEQGLTINDKTAIYYSYTGDDQAILDSLKKHESKILKDTISSKLTKIKEGENFKDIIINGETIGAGIAKE